MVKEFIDDELWALIEPLLPVRPARDRRSPGRPPVDDRAALNGIVFVLHTGIGWNRMPRELGWGSGTVCWRKLDAWKRAGIWQRVQDTMVAEWHRRGRIDLARGIGGSVSVCAVATANVISLDAHRAARVRAS